MRSLPVNVWFSFVDTLVSRLVSFSDVAAQGYFQVLTCFPLIFRLIECFVAMRAILSIIMLVYFFCDQL
jgi:ABC-type microcin C transport system permease subunit YejE